MSNAYLGALPQLAARFDAFRANLHAAVEDAAVREREIAESRAALVALRQALTLGDLLASSSAEGVNDAALALFDRVPAELFDSGHVPVVEASVQSLVRVERERLHQIADALNSLDARFHRVEEVQTIRRMQQRVAFALQVQVEMVEMRMRRSAAVGLVRRTPSKAAPPQSVHISIDGLVRDDATM